jgi:predicted transcriptional regulator
MTTLLQQIFTNRTVKLVLIFFLVYSCSFYSKKNYLEDFTQFVDDVKSNFQNYTEEDWKLKDADFNNYTTELYDQFKDEFNEDDQELIGKLKTRYLLAKSKYEMKNLGEQIKDGLSQMEGAIKEIFNEDNVDQMKGAKEELTDNNNN